MLHRVRHFGIMLTFGSLALGSLIVGVNISQGQQGQAVTARQGIEFFESKIRPVLVNRCYECHSASATKVRGGLYLDTRHGLLQGGDNGPAIVPGDPGKSLLIRSLRHAGDVKMPPKDKLSDQVIADFEQWVRMGAPDPRTSDASWKRLTLEDAKNFWSFKPMQKSAVPAVKNRVWATSDVDRFILARLEAKGLQPVADAEPAALLRRLSLDLIGLPPTPEEVEQFVAACQPTESFPWAYEKAVDRLLASKHFGERWGRYWLDIARYAESNGNADNTPFPQAWRYRDYVIQSFNDDKPYNRFITEQIAGDLLDAKGDAEKDANRTATGFLALTSKPRAQNNPDYRMDLVADQLDVTCRTILAMTVTCARCHDHKFDPIPTRDYYALAGIFDSSEMRSGGAGKGANNKKGGVGGAGLVSLSQGGFAMGVEEGRPTDTAICIRGDSTKRGAVAPRGYLTVATTAGTKPVNKAQSGRLELAAWLTQPDNPLTSRVVVNRIWRHLFGQGLSRAVDNFGLHGEEPTHPELLDFLALKFQDDGWSFKKMIRYLVLTRTYRMSSAHDAKSFTADPDNRLWWRIPSRRLDAEAIRDSMLFVSGKLIATPPQGSLASPVAKKGPAATPQEKAYRSVYLGIVRNNLPESLAIFDVADPSLIVGQREVTTVPAQALYLMNSPFVVDQAQTLAKRLLAENHAGDAARIERAFRVTLCRGPTDAERTKTAYFLTEGQEGGGAQLQAWTAFCQTLLISAEFRYVH